MTRAQIVERLARGLYEREKIRDRTSHEKQAEWEDLNFGRKATRLHYADELFEILFGGFGFSWEMVDALRLCVDARRDAVSAPHAEGGTRAEATRTEGDRVATDRDRAAAGAEPSSADTDPVAAEAGRAIDIIVTLLPPRIAKLRRQPDGVP